MEQRARAIVYWQGMSKDIRESREGCADCNRNVPHHLRHHHPHLKLSSQTSPTLKAVITWS